MGALLRYHDVSFTPLPAFLSQNFYTGLLDRRMAVYDSSDRPASTRASLDQDNKACVHAWSKEVT